MEQAKSNGILDKMQKVLMPIGTKLANQRHLSAISAGLMSTISLTMVGAVFQILASPPVTAEMMAEGHILATIFGWWYNLATEYQSILMVPKMVTMDLLGVVVAVTIAYNLAKNYKLNQISSGVMSLVVFVMVAAPSMAIPIEGAMAPIAALNIGYLGSTGMFTAILIALVTVEITRLCRDKNIILKMPDVVPPSLSSSFTAMIPMLFNIIIFLTISQLSQHFGGVYLPQVISDVLATPLSALTSGPGMLVLVLFASVLWIFGIHGTMIVYPLIMPLMFEAIAGNGALVAQGMAPVFAPVMLFGAMQMAGGTGNTLGLSLMAAKSAKSEQLKAIGKVGIVPGVFGINEPVIFGTPIMYNPIMAIPFIVANLTVTLLLWGAFSLGLLQPSYIMIMSLMPIGLGGFLGSMDWRQFVFPWLMVPLTGLIYYPFFKIYDKQLVAQEAKVREESENEAIGA